MFRFNVLLLSVSLPFVHAATAIAGDEHNHGAHHSHDHHSEASENSRGPHGGKLLHDEGFAVEIKIYEDGTPPHFRAYLYRDGEPAAATSASVTVELLRFGRSKERFDLRPAGGYLTDDKIVEEPHSFAVKVTASGESKVHSWEYESHEGRTHLDEPALEIADISIEQVGPQEIATVFDVFGRLLPSQDRVTHITPRFPGVVREIPVNLGDQVARGDLLAVIESNHSLQRYEIRSTIAGEVIRRHATVGEFVRDDEEILVVADLREIWADFQVYRDDFDRITKGQKIRVEIGQSSPMEATVAYVSPVTDEATQSKLVRAVLRNPQGALRPGLFVTGSLAAEIVAAPLAVRREAVQTFRDWEVVYLTDGHTFQAMPVKLGRRDDKYVEILSGVLAGDRYVARNSYIIKADIEKSGASHDH